MQGIFSGQAYQFLARLYKEYSLAGTPGLRLVWFQFDVAVEGVRNFDGE